MPPRPARFAALILLLVAAPPSWAQAPSLQPPQPAAVLKLKSRSPTTIEAQSIEGVSELEVTARGKVEFQREDLSIYSEYLRYNQEFGRINATGGVRMLRGTDRFFGPRLDYNTLDDTGTFEGSNFILQGETATMRGTAERTEFLGKSRMRMLKATFSTCQPDKEDWRLEAGQFELDNDRQVGTVRDARLKFFDTTILPLPYGTFSLDNQRQTGFLAPYYSHNTLRGLELSVPFYWNIAPEKDATFVADTMSKRGEQYKGEFRYIDPSYRGNLNLEYMPNDKQLDRARGAIALQHTQTLAPGLTGVLDINRVSDSRYFVDLSSQVRQVSAGNLQQMGQLSYGRAGPLGTGLYISGMYQHWQTLQDPLSPTVPPYAREPQVNFGLTRNDIGGLFDLAFPGETVRFTHPTMLEGNRLQLNPTLSAPYLAPGYFLTPKVGAHFADYTLDMTRLTPGQPSKPTSTVPWMSLDGGLVFDRPVSWFGEQRTQTFEPRLFYVYAPYHNQDNLPVFDTGLADLNYSQIFTENRFAGGDRFGDANQLTLAATSRILADSGAELLRGTIAQRYYFTRERVELPGTTPRTTSVSDVLASLGARLARNLTVDGSVQYDPHDTRWERYTLSARYAPEVAKVISMSYRYNRDVTPEIHQVDITGQWPVATGWYAIGRFNYSFFDSRVLEGIAGLEYNAGCWVFRTAYQRLQAATNTTSSGIFFQLEFNGFGGVGSDEIITMLKRSVPGYMVTNPSQSGLVPPSLQRPLPFQQVF